MRRYLLAALWPAGIAAIMATTVIKARQAGGTAGSGTGGGRSEARPASAAGSGVAAGLGSGLAGNERQGTARAGYPAGLVPGVFRRAAEPVARRDWASGLLQLGAISCADGALSYGVMALLGRVILNHCPAIDEPIVSWTTKNQIDWWAAVTERFSRIGRRSTIRGAAGTAAVCLAVTWRERKWLPPVVLASAFLVDYNTTRALRRKFRRPGPPDSPRGSYPCGGCDRVVLFYGLIAHLLWREFGASQRGKCWAIGAVSALAFTEAYSQQYLSRHWFTDVASGLVYGAVLLAPFLAAMRLIAGAGRCGGWTGPARYAAGKAAQTAAVGVGAGARGR
jgi:membrane-associated phospholipid phosphatase